MTDIKTDTQTNDILSEQVEKVHFSILAGQERLSSLGGNLVRVPLAKQGNWKHEVYGEVAFTDNDFQTIVSNIKDNKLGFEPYLTLGHLDEEPNSTDSHRKRGPLINAFTEGDTLYGDFVVKPDLYNSIKNGEYEYASGEFLRHYLDKEDGKDKGTTLVRVALTNSPFIPFGDTKIQALSQSSSNCPPGDETIVFSLLAVEDKNSLTLTTEELGSNSIDEIVKEEASSTDDIQILNNIEPEPIMVDNTIASPDIKEEVKEEVKPLEIETSEEVETKLEATIETPVIEETKEEVVVPQVVEATAEEVLKVEQPTPKIEKNMAEVAIENLTSQLNSIKSSYEEQISKANEVIESLAAQVKELTSKLSAQEQVTQAFSQSLNASQEKALLNKLSNAGVTPAVIQKFSALKNAMSSNDVVKLSTSAGEVNSTLLDAVADLVISASTQEPVVFEQLGVSSAKKTFGGMNFESIISRNKEVATKTKLS